MHGSATHLAVGVRKAHEGSGETEAHEAPPDERQSLCVEAHRSEAGWFKEEPPPHETQGRGLRGMICRAHDEA